MTSRVPAALARLSIAMEQLEKVVATQSLQKTTAAPAAPIAAKDDTLIKEFQALQSDYAKLKQLAANLSLEVDASITDVDDVLGANA